MEDKITPMKKTETKGAKKRVPQAVKRMRKSAEVAKRNRSIRTEAKAVAKSAQATPSLLNRAYQVIDRAIKRGVFNRRKGARMKSRLAKSAKEKTGS